MNVEERVCDEFWLGPFSSIHTVMGLDMAIDYFLNQL